MVKAKFLNGTVKEVHRGEDNRFHCNCGNVLQHPLSLLRHAKQCSNAEPDNGIQLADCMSQFNDFMSKYEIMNVASLGDGNGDMEVENSGDCIGIQFRGKC